MTWYLSGPMTGLPDFNFPAFSYATTLLRERGLSIVSPHEHVVEPHDGTWCDFLRADIGMLTKDCDGIVLLKGWSKSNGAQLELSVALKLGFAVRYFNEATGEMVTIE